jgi:hypothetical protein
MIQRKQWLGRAIALGILIGAAIVVAFALLRLTHGRTRWLSVRRYGRPRP